jgi:hypothetical protein
VPIGGSTPQGVLDTGGFNGDPRTGQDASFGWMMPTLPGAISDSPLRGVFAPDERLGGRMQLGAMG